MSNKSHLAAPYRNHLSATAKAMLKHSLLFLDESHLDYGCGRGGDVERLTSSGYKSTGYDPYYFPSQAPLADVVTMSYVLNVIADPEERREALLSAWKSAKKRLIISTNVSGKAVSEGYFTPLGTFTKSYNHVELKAYIESTLGFEAVSIAKDKFVVHRNGRQFTSLHREEVLARIEAIAHQGWVPPMGVIIKGYCTDFKPRAGFDEIDTGDFPGRVRYYRLLAKTRCLPGKNGQLVRVVHIKGGKESEMMQWAIASLKRRNQIAEMKFHCIEQSFLTEFYGTKNFDFLDIDNVKIYR